MEKTNKEPPLVLVKTWYELMKQSDNREANARGEEMLMSAFGSKEAIDAYLRKHKIIR